MLYLKNEYINWADYLIADSDTIVFTLCFLNAGGPLELNFLFFFAFFSSYWNSFKLICKWYIFSFYSQNWVRFENWELSVYNEMMKKIDTIDSNKQSWKKDVRF